MRCPYDNAKLNFRFKFLWGKYFEIFWIFFYQRGKLANANVPQRWNYMRGRPFTAFPLVLFHYSFQKKLVIVPTFNTVLLFRSKRKYFAFCKFWPGLALILHSSTFYSIKLRNLLSLWGNVSAIWVAKTRKMSGFTFAIDAHYVKIAEFVIAVLLSNKSYILRISKSLSL